MAASMAAHSWYGIIMKSSRRKVIQNIIFLLVGLCFLLGFAGSFLTKGPDGKDLKVLDHAYRAIQLFFLDGVLSDKKTNELDFMANLARFLAPIATVSFLLSWFLGFHNWLQFLTRPRKDHTVLYGLDDSSLSFILGGESSGLHRNAVIVITEDEENPYVEYCRDRGICVIAEDSGTKVALKKARVCSAKAFLALGMNDEKNIETILQVQEMLEDTSKKKSGREQYLKIVAHVEESRLSSRLTYYNRFTEERKNTDTSFFNIYQLCARKTLREHPLELYADIKDVQRPCLAFYGFGKMAEELLLQAVKVGHFLTHQPIKAIIFDSRANELKSEFFVRYPQISPNKTSGLEAIIPDIDFVNIEFSSYTADFGGNEPPFQEISQHFVSFDSNERSITFALSLREKLLERQKSNGPIFVRLSRREGLAKLLMPIEHHVGTSKIPDNLHAFGIAEDLLTPDELLNADEEARRLHEKYIGAVSGLREGQSTWAQASQVSWQMLSTFFKNSNRSQADHIPVKLRMLRLSARSDISQVRSTDTGDDVKKSIHQNGVLLSEVEHNRWTAERLLGGWHYGPQRVDVAKRHPDITAWKDLPEERRKIDRNHIESIANALGGHLPLQPNLFIALAGHRPAKLFPDIALKKEDEKKLLASIRNLAQKLRDAYPHCSFTLFTCLAEGADRYLARYMKEELEARKADVKIWALLPLPFDIYQKRFGRIHDDEIEKTMSIREFAQMIDQTDRYFELPLRFGNMYETAKEENLLRKQYALANAYMVQRSDLLVVIWDTDSPATSEERERRYGGTWQLVEWWDNPEIIPQEFHWNEAAYFLKPVRQESFILLPPWKER